MFQQPMQYGPGTGTFIDHSLEILIMLAGAFMLGLWLGWLLWSRYRNKFEKFRVENESHAAAALTLRTQVEELHTRLSAAETERASLNAEVNNLRWENTELRQKLDNAQSELVQATTKLRQMETELALAQQLPSEPLALPEPEKPAFDWDVVANVATLQPETAIPTFVPELPKPLPVLDEVVDNAVDNGAAVLDLSVFDILAADMPSHHHPLEEVLDLGPDDLQPSLPMLNTDDGADATPIPPPPGVAPLPSEDEALESTLKSVANPAALGAKGLGIPPLDIPDVLPDDETAAPDHTHAFISKGVVSPLTFESPVLPEPEPVALLMADAQADDLKIVEGIGPKIESLLIKNGIRTYLELAAAPVDRLRAILVEAGPQYAIHDPGTWSAQALLAANGEWENLKAYQEFLDGGKKPK